MACCRGRARIGSLPSHNKVADWGKVPIKNLATLMVERGGKDGDRAAITTGEIQVIQRRGTGVRKRKNGPYRLRKRVPCHSHVAQPYWLQAGNSEE